MQLMSQDADLMSNVQIFQFSNGSLFQWSIGPLVHWPIGPLDHWSIGALVHSTIGPLVHWSIGPLVDCLMINVNKAKRYFPVMLLQWEDLQLRAPSSG